MQPLSILNPVKLDLIDGVSSNYKYKCGISAPPEAVPTSTRAPHLGYHEIEAIFLPNNALLRDNVLITKYPFAPFSTVFPLRVNLNLFR